MREDLRRQRRARPDAELAKDVAQARFHRLGAEVQGGRDLLVRVAFGDQLDDAPLGLGQPRTGPSPYEDSGQFAGRPLLPRRRTQSVEDAVRLGETRAGVEHVLRAALRGYEV